MMRAARIAVCVLGISVALSFVIISDPAQARCRTFQASHNGTDMFNESGAVGAAINKLVSQVESWKRQKGIRKARMGKVRTKCGKWFMKYMLPHRHCVAKARVCT